MSTLLAAGIDPNEEDFQGRTAIYYAFDRGQLDIADELIRAGADLNHRDKSGKNIFEYVEATGNQLNLK